MIARKRRIRRATDQQVGLGGMGDERASAIDGVCDGLGNQEREPGCDRRRDRRPAAIECMRAPRDQEEQRNQDDDDRHQVVGDGAKDAVEEVRSTGVDRLVDLEVHRPSFGTLLREKEGARPGAGSEVALVKFL